MDHWRFLILNKSLYRQFLTTLGFIADFHNRFLPGHFNGNILNLSYIWLMRNMNLVCKSLPEMCRGQRKLDMSGWWLFLQRWVWGLQVPRFRCRNSSRSIWRRGPCISSRHPCNSLSHCTQSATTKILHLNLPSCVFSWIS